VTSSPAPGSSSARRLKSPSATCRATWLSSRICLRSGRTIASTITTVTAEATSRAITSEIHIADRNAISAWTSSSALSRGPFSTM